MLDYGKSSACGFTIVHQSETAIKIDVVLCGDLFLIGHKITQLHAESLTVLLRYQNYQPYGMAGSIFPETIQSHFSCPLHTELASYKVDVCGHLAGFSFLPI